VGVTVGLGEKRAVSTRKESRRKGAGKGEERPAEPSVGKDFCEAI